ncbi:MAG: hypothetical protein ACLSA6_03300 [Holdemania massiliensis]
MGDQTGSIEVGKCADFMVTRRNLDDLTALRNIKMVVAAASIMRIRRLRKCRMWNRHSIRLFKYE